MRILFLFGAAAALLTAPENATATELTNAPSANIGTLCDPATEPNCPPPVEFEPRIPLKACAKLLESQAPADVYARLCLPVCDELDPVCPATSFDGHLSLALAATLTNLGDGDVGPLCDPGVDPGCVPIAGLPSCSNLNLHEHADPRAIAEVCSRNLPDKKGNE